MKAQELGKKSDRCWVSLLCILYIYVLLGGLLTGCSSSRPSIPQGPVTPTNPTTSSPWYPLLGNIEPQRVKETPKYHIKYQSNGFDRIRKNQIRKTSLYLEDIGAKHLVTDFQIVANSVENLPNWIDEAYEKNILQYQSCGGRFLDFIVNNNPRTIFVVVMATPEYVPSVGQYAGGMALLDKNTVKCVIVAANGIRTNPKTSDLRQFKDYVKWEIGNLLGLRYGYKPSNVNNEWGDKIPCQQRQQ